MKYLTLVIFILALILNSCTNNYTEKNNTFTINGNIDNNFSGEVYLYKRQAGEWIELDSASTDNGIFQFKGNIENPEMYFINITGHNRFASFFAEPGEIFVHLNPDDLRNPEVTGSQAQAQYDAFLDQMDVFDNKMNEAWANIKSARSENDSASENKWQMEYDEADREEQKYILDFAMNNNNSVVAAYALLNNAYYFDENDLEPVVSNFDESIKNSEYVQRLEERVIKLKRVAVGKPAIDFTMTDIDEKNLTLSSLYGKYLLVDFWASWCGPCRMENPNVVEAYKKYHNKGFDILGVSFDDNYDKWVEAVKNDELTWHQVSDLKGWANAAGMEYAINSIPSNMLLNPEGIIIAKNLRGEDLQNKLAEILGN
ncbi:MAG: AhpC/TSA family protein [Bacteroidales bacterium]|nr:AhpC/TSA family protein [Bacteroidales bacterium]